MKKYFFSRILFVGIRLQPRPQRIFSLQEESEKEALEYFKHVIKICPNRGHIFKNKLGNAWAAILKTTDSWLKALCIK